MEMNNKQFWLDLAEVIDAWRVIPKIFMLGYAYMCWDVYIWAKGHPELEAAKWIFAAVYGVAGLVTNAYFQSGRKWNNKE